MPCFACAHFRRPENKEPGVWKDGDVGTCTVDMPWKETGALQHCGRRVFAGGGLGFSNPLEWWLSRNEYVDLYRAERLQRKVAEKALKAARAEIRQLKQAAKA